eukprot:gb/GFBE01070713.1/.p1 GENE.gb/GFBE01070713.1/~~gb/GFBE01070713.1/.p1  ORF type:complete len:222 (+),score=47.97 gb/GFBE01070713.1/:1-666(+)
MSGSDTENDVEQALLSNGLPAKPPYENMNPMVIYPIFTLVQLGLGYLAAWGIYAATAHERVDEKIKTLRENDLQYFYWAVVVLTLIPSILQTFVAKHRKLAHVDNPDQYVYKTMTSGGPETPYVRLEYKGDVGQFNRSQRGIDNFREVYPTILAYVLLAGYVFPLPTLIATVVLLIGRSLYSMLYIQSPGGRGGGFGISLLATLVLNGLVLFTAVQASMTK